MSDPRPSSSPAMSIAQANRVLLAEPRFELTRRAPSSSQLGEWKSGPKTIADVLAIQRDHGDREFLVYEDERCTYSGAVNASETIAVMLVDAGLKQGDRVALVMRNRLEWPVCFFGAILAGGVVVPVNGWSLPDEMRAMIEDCGARFLFSDRVDIDPPSNIERTWAPGVGVLRSVIGEPTSWSVLPKPTIRFATPAPDDLAALFYTSGTTSRPKGATMTHRALTATIMNSEFNAARVRLRYPTSAPPHPVVASKPAALFPVPLFHVTGAIPGLIGSSAQGAKIVFMRKWDVEEAYALLNRNASICSAVFRPWPCSC